MGNRQCCCWKRQIQESEDVLSENKSVELNVKNKKSISKKASKRKQKKSLQLQSFKQQEQAFFNKNNAFKLQQRLINPKLSQFQQPQQTARPTLQRDNSFYLNKIRGQIRPQLHQVQINQDNTKQKQLHVDLQSQSEGNSQMSQDQQPKNRQKSNQTSTIDYSTLRTMAKYQTIAVQKGSSDANQQKKILQQQLKGNSGQQIDNKFKVRIRLAVCCIQLEQYKQAQKQLKIVLKELIQTQKPEEKVFLFDIYTILGKCYKMQQKNSQAVSHFLKAIKTHTEIQAADSFKLFQPFYEVGDLYLNQKDYTSARKYLSKCQKMYQKHHLQDKQLQLSLLLSLGKLQYLSEEYVEADKHFIKAIKMAQDLQIADKQTASLFGAGLNFYAMDSYKVACMTFSRLYKLMRKHNMTDDQFYQEVCLNLKKIIREMAEAKISENELKAVIRYCSECLPGSEQVQALKGRLKQMQQILYKQ